MVEKVQCTHNYMYTHMYIHVYTYVYIWATVCQSKFLVSVHEFLINFFSANFIHLLHVSQLLRNLTLTQINSILEVFANDKSRVATPSRSLRASVRCICTCMAYVRSPILRMRSATRKRSRPDRESIQSS